MPRAAKSGTRALQRWKLRFCLRSLCQCPCWTFSWGCPLQQNHSNFNGEYWQIHLRKYYMKDTHLAATEAPVGASAFLEQHALSSLARPRAVANPFRAGTVLRRSSVLLTMPASARNPPPITSESPSPPRLLASCADTPDAVAAAATLLLAFVGCRSSSSLSSPSLCAAIKRMRLGP